MRRFHTPLHEHSFIFIVHLQYVYFDGVGSESANTCAAPGSVSENKLLLNYCSCHGNILADSVLPPADLEEVDDTTVLGKLDQERIRTGD